MSQTLIIDLRRSDTSVPWGFRLEGGMDIGVSIRIMKVVPGSISENVGLLPGDYVLMINQSSTERMTHEQAKMEIIRSANDISFTIARSSFAGPPQRIWQPTVISSAKIVPLNSSRIQQSPHLVSKTSLKANQANPRREFNAFNAVPVPFGDKSSQLITQNESGRIKKVSHNQFNSPMGLYSNSNAAATLNNTMKAANLASGGPIQNIKSPPSSMYCGSCGEIIKGVFVRVHGEIPMHPACLKCCKCGVGLKNVGYFYINDRLYCEVHAKQTTRPGSDMYPIATYK